MSDTSTATFDAQPASAGDPAGPIKLALILSAVAAVGLLAWNMIAVLS